MHSNTARIGLEIHEGVLRTGTRYGIVDDLIATGGTAAATMQLAHKYDAEIACCSFLIELSFSAGPGQAEWMPGREPSDLRLKVNLMVAPNDKIRKPAQRRRISPSGSSSASASPIERF